jgi:hypothetical protein
VASSAALSMCVKASLSEPSRQVIREAHDESELDGQELELRMQMQTRNDHIRVLEDNVGSRD